MPVCICGFSTEMPNCNGTHRIVKAVREAVANDIKSDETLDQETKDRLVAIVKKHQRGY